MQLKNIVIALNNILSLIWCFMSLWYLFSNGPSYEHVDKHCHGD